MPVSPSSSPLKSGRSVKELKVSEVVVIDLLEGVDVVIYFILRFLGEKDGRFACCLGCFKW